jgi:tetratricopeptide (TPR) repeat protein
LKSSIKLILFDVLATARTLFLAVCVFICLFSLLIEEAHGAINASRIYQLQQRLIENPRDVESHLNIAMEYGAANDFLKAVEAYFTLLRVDPNNFHAYNNLGILYKKSGQYRDSLHCYEQAEKIDPESAWVPYNKGLCYEAMGRMQEARESYGRALSLNPSFSQALQRLRILSGSEEQIASSQTFEEAQILIAVSPKPESNKAVVKTEPIKPQPNRS